MGRQVVALTPAEFLEKLRAIIWGAGGVVKWCRAHGFHFENIYALFRPGARPPSDRIAKAAGYRRRVIYEPEE